MKHDYAELMQLAKTRAIETQPLVVFKFAAENGHDALADEAGRKASVEQPIEVFQVAKEHGYELAETVATMALKLEGINPDGARNFQKNHVFEVLEYAAKEGRNQLMTLAADVSRTDKPDYGRAADQLGNDTLRAWVRGL